jgi:hypothetical protein
LGRYQINTIVILQNGNMSTQQVEKCNLAKWQAGKMASWQKWQVGKNGKLAEWQVGKNGRLAKIASSLICKLAKWQVGKIASWL